jgi:hypothetical protein
VPSRSACGAYSPLVQPARERLRGEHIDPGQVAAESVEARDEPILDRGAPGCEHNWNCRSRLFCGKRPGGGADNEHSHLTANHIGRQRAIKPGRAISSGSALLEHHAAGPGALASAHLTRNSARLRRLSRVPAPNTEHSQVSQRCRRHQLGCARTTLPMADTG